MVNCCVYPSNLGIKSILYNISAKYINKLIVVYILQILESRASYTTTLIYTHIYIMLCISFKSWNQEHPIQLVPAANLVSQVVYILQILESRASYTTRPAHASKGHPLCISFKSWNQEHPIQLRLHSLAQVRGCVYPSNLGIKSILYNIW